ncbi:Uncharacterised protein [Mycoplasmopsis maculosa]|uniref:Uncharacterized protein n=1 Tax=Mycoplasmopsis maculosa TaxID=114885 RepID=A0A449B4U7_9BACT|nr:hypothetical protein [Mycoplasmopsis maculosa]VEU75633.1 Uncharacterised protein [Mycoplasmopsis maculosa]
MNNKKIFLSFNILLLILFITTILFIGIFIAWTNNYNSKLYEENTPQSIKSIIDWKVSYLTSFVLIFLSFLIIWVSQFAILITNDNGFLKSLLPLFFINKLSLHNLDTKREKRNLISLISILSIVMILSLINAWFNIYANKIQLSFIIYTLFIAVILILYIPVAFQLKINFKKALI